MRLAKRTGKVFIDWMRNGRGATSIAPYSLRARSGARVSMPLSWEELDEAAPDAFTMHDALARIEAERAMLASSLPADLLDAYKKTAARTGGVAVGRLQGSNCGVCRMAIEGGRLIDMKGQGNVAPCPQCGRLLILE